MRILLTGCAGFIGSRVASLLLDSGYEVYGTDSLEKSAYPDCRNGGWIHSWNLPASIFLGRTYPLGRN